MKSKSCQAEVQVGDVCATCGIKASEEVPIEEKIEKEATKTKYIIGLRGVVILFVVLMSMALMQLSGEREMMYYEKRGGETFIEYDKGKYIELGDETRNILFNKSIDLITYIDDDKLMQQTLRGKEKEIDDGIDNFVVSEDGSVIIGLRDYDWGDEVGQLIYYKNGKEVATISQAAYGHVRMSPDGSYVAFLENGGDHFNLFLSKKGEKVKEVTDGVIHIIDVTNTGEILYLDEKDNLIWLDKNYKERKISDDVWSLNNLISHPTLKRIFAINQDKDLGVYQNNEWVEIVDEVLCAGSFVLDNEELISYRTYNHEVGIVFEDGSILKIGEVYNDEYTDFTYMNNEQVLFLNQDRQLCTMALKPEVKPEVIGADVMAYGFSPEGAYIYYVDEDRDGYVKKGSKKADKVAEDVLKMVVDDSGNIYFIDEENALFWIDRKGKAVRIADDIWAIEAWKDDRVTVRDEDLTLYLAKKDKQLKEVLGDVQAIYSIIPNSPKLPTKSSLTTYNFN